MRITESRIRQIIRQEAKNLVSEAQDERLMQSEDNDIPLHQLVQGLRGADDFYPEAADLRSKLQSLKGDFEDGMAVIRPSKSGEGYDVFVHYSSNNPLNAKPIPSKILSRGGANYQRGMSSAMARRRGIKGYNESRRRAGKRALRESPNDGRWLAGHNGYEFEGMPELERAWSDFTDAVARLQSFAHDKFEDTEAGDEASVADVAAHQVQIILAQS